MIAASYENCHLCPRDCGVDRTVRAGVCGATNVVRVGRAALHWWEEPCLVGDSGSGAVFFSYCSLGCVYCQNRVLAQGAGVDVSEETLAKVFLRLQNEEHAANINLVTPTHYVPSIASVLKPLRESGALHIPVVYNTSSYENRSALQLMDGLVDIYLADFKYADASSAAQLSRAKSYPEVSLAALAEMQRQVPDWAEDADGLLQRGIIVRHLVLPGRIEESMRALKVLADSFGNGLRLSIMSQYTPLAEGGAAGRVDFNLADFGLDGRVSASEYEQVLDYADFLGFEDYFWQEGGADQESFIPAFDGTGVL